MAVAAAYTFSGFFQVSLIVKVHCKLVDKCKFCIPNKPLKSTFRLVLDRIFTGDYGG